MKIVSWINYLLIHYNHIWRQYSHLRTQVFHEQIARYTRPAVIIRWHAERIWINTSEFAVLRQWASLSVAALLVVAAGVHRLRPVRGRTQVLFELAAVQIVQHVQLDLFQVELQGGPGRTQQAPVQPGLPLIHMGSCWGGETVLHVLTAVVHLRLCRVGGRVESVRCCYVWKNRSVCVAAAQRVEVGGGAGESVHARVGWLLVLEQVGEVVGHHEARAAERRMGGGSICTWGLGALLQLLPPAGPVLVVGVVDGVLDPETLGLLHVGAFLSQRHGLPGLSCEEESGG